MGGGSALLHVRACASAFRAVGDAFEKYCFDSSVPSTMPSTFTPLTFVFEPAISAAHMLVAVAKKRIVFAVGL